MGLWQKKKPHEFDLNNGLNLIYHSNLLRADESKRSGLVA